MGTPRLGSDAAPDLPTASSVDARGEESGGRATFALNTVGAVLLRIHSKLMEVLNAIGTAWVAGITVLICADILGRVLFSSPIIGVPEIVKVSVVAIVWLQMAHTLKIGGHLRSDVVLGRLSRKGRSIMNLIAYALGAIIFGLLVWSGWNTMIMAWELGEFEGEQPVRVPTYPLRSIVLLGAGLTCLQFLLMAAEVIGRLFTSGDEECR